MWRWLPLSCNEAYFAAKQLETTACKSLPDLFVLLLLLLLLLLAASPWFAGCRCQRASR
jgi:hypothetical protein